jgi:hypothetical protein
VDLGAVVKASRGLGAPLGRPLASRYLQSVSR